MPTIRIKGLPFELHRRWPIGHRLTAGEAQALTQVFAENVRNNVDSRVAGGLVEGSLEHLALQDEIGAYAAGYEFVESTRVQPLSGLERLALVVAEERLRIEHGLGPDDPVATAAVALVALRGEVREEAKRRLAVEQAATQEALKELL